MKKIQNKSIAKPFVKWAGGKYKLSGILMEETEQIINLENAETYIDPFVGGGGMFFAITKEYDFKRKIISDINAELINTYITVRDDLDNLIVSLKNIEVEFNSLDSDEKKKEYYLKLRENYNSNILNNILNIEQATLFIALNKLGFNGLYRVNSKGLFNVPFGQKKKANIFDEINLRNVSELLKDTEIYCMDFKETEKFIDDKTLVYFDSPYRPITSTQAFTAYSKGAFNDDNQIELAKYARRISELGGKFFLSNSDPTQINEDDLFFDDLYKGYVIKRVNVRRGIGAKASSRGIVSEILVIGE